MSVSDLSASTQDYLKSIWALSEWSDTPVTPKSIADAMGLQLSSVSDAVRRLSKQGLVDHVPYGSVSLTDAGRAHAVAMVRRHRLIETFLVQVLGYGWEQVHDEAEHLEHAVSDFLIDRIDAFLDHPTRDPHGDPIPNADGSVFLPEAVPLSEVPSGSAGVVERILDGDPALLQFFDEQKIALGTRLFIGEGAPFTGTIEVRIEEGDQTVVLGPSATSALYVSISRG